MIERTIAVLEGDQTRQELLDEALRVLEPSVIRVPLNFARFDLSLKKRRETDNQIVRDAAATLREHGLGIKAATITPEKAGDAGSPNVLLREEIDGKVILRVGRTLPGIRPMGGVYALLSVKAGKTLVIPALNHDGGCLSDLVLQMFGSIAGSESVILSFDQDFNVKTVIAEAPHGTAPSLFKKNIANPLALILAGAALLSAVGSQDAGRASRAIYESALEAIYAGVATSNLGGSASTSDFTDGVINRVTRKLEVWGTLG